MTKKGLAGHIEGFEFDSEGEACLCMCGVGW